MSIFIMCGILIFEYDLLCKLKFVFVNKKYIEVRKMLCLMLK